MRHSKRAIPVLCHCRDLSIFPLKLSHYINWWHSSVHVHAHAQTYTCTYFRYLSLHFSVLLAHGILQAFSDIHTTLSYIDQGTGEDQFNPARACKIIRSVANCCQNSLHAQYYHFTGAIYVTSRLAWDPCAFRMESSDHCACRMAQTMPALPKHFTDIASQYTRVPLYEQGAWELSLCHMSHATAIDHWHALKNAENHIWENLT